MSYRPDLDGLRAIAVALVMADHYGLIGNGGIVGVTLFFVLSGYLITRILVDERKRAGAIDLGRFYVRRARRLVPALAALLAFVVLVMLVQGHSPAGDVLPAALYIGNYWKAAGLGDLGMLGHTWSLSVEEQFYLVWPVVLLFIRDRRVLLVALVGTIAIAFLRRPLETSDWSYFATDSRGDALAIGCILGLLPSLKAPWWAVPSVWAALIGFAFLPQLVNVPFTLVALGCAIPVLAGGRLLAWHPLVRVGQVSYAIYLWQQPLRDLLDPRGQPVVIAWARIAVLIAVTVAIAFASERWVERPFRLRKPEPIEDTADRQVADAPVRRQPHAGDGAREAGVVVQ